LPSAPGTRGSAVGYHVRLEAHRGPDTRLLFCTTGVLLRMLCAGDSAVACSHVVLDEVRRTHACDARCTTAAPRRAAPRRAPFHEHRRI